MNFNPNDEVDVDIDDELDADKEAARAALAEKHAKKDTSWRFILILFAILLPIRLFVAEPFLVYGSSMEPTFETGDYLIVDELTYRIKDPKRGDVVVLKPPYDEKRHFIKRIVGLPGETIDVKGNKVTIFNAAHPEGMILNESYIQFPSDKESKVTLSSSEYYVMGDNRSVSYDSRSWGPLPKDHITGRAMFRLYPLSSIGILPGSIPEAK